MNRRQYLGLTVGVVGLAGCGASSGGDTEAWFQNVDNYDGEVDRRGRERVTVAVGADDGFAFAPAAIRVDTGTTVIWEWTGKGGRHNVVARDGSFTSPYHSDAGATFELPVSDTGTIQYLCEPHQSMGMKGSLRVV